MVMKSDDRAELSSAPRGGPTVDARRSRRLSVSLIVLLVATGVMAGVGPTFPRDVDAGRAWRFMLIDPIVLIHVLLGLAVPVIAVVMVVAASRRFVPSLVLVGAGLAVSAGCWYVQAHQPEAALTIMTAGWLLSLSASVVHLLKIRRAARKATGG